MGEKTKSKRNIIIGILLGAILITEIALGLWFYIILTLIGESRKTYPFFSKFQFLGDKLHRFLENLLNSRFKNFGVQNFEIQNSHG